MTTSRLTRADIGSLAGYAAGNVREAGPEAVDAVRQQLREWLAGDRSAALAATLNTLVRSFGEVPEDAEAMTSLEGVDSETRALTEDHFTRCSAAAKSGLSDAELDALVEAINVDLQPGPAPRKRRDSRLSYSVLARAILIAVGWLLWHPLAGVLAIFTLANLRTYAVRESLFWAPRKASLIGALYGVVLGAVVALSVSFTVQGALGSGFFAVLGLCGALYLGYDQGPIDTARAIAQWSAVGAYILTVGGYFGVRALM